MKKQSLFVLVLILVTSIAIPFAYSQSPISISVEPENDTASPGELKEYIITITAEQGYMDTGYVELEINALNYYEYYYIGDFEPPYPAVLEYEFPVPEDVPADVTAIGTITAYSGAYEVETETTLRIRSGGILGSLLGWVLSVLDRLRNIFS